MGIVFQIRLYDTGEERIRKQGQKGDRRDMDQALRRGFKNREDAPVCG